MTGTRCSNSATRATHVWTSTGSNRGLREFCKTRVGSEEAAEAFAACGDDVKTSDHVLFPVIGAGRSLKQGSQAGCDGH